MSTHGCYRDVVLGHWDFFAWLLSAGELAIAIGLIMGLVSRLAALGALDPLRIQQGS